MSKSIPFIYSPRFGCEEKLGFTGKFDEQKSKCRNCYASDSYVAGGVDFVNFNKNALIDSQK
jgi:hypothetical protein